MKKYISIILFTLIIAGSSCKKNFLSLEANPNTPSAASPELLLSGALKTAAGFPNSTTYTMYACWVGYLSYSTGFQVNTALEQYIITTGTYDAWTNYYLNLSNFSALAATNAGPNYTAISKIMTVYDYEALVDNYNNVPYSEALKGVGNLIPAYDTGSAIYDDLMKQLDAAIVLIQGAPSTTKVPGAGDIMFAGNMTNWIKFANTLKLRLALRQSNIASKTTALKAAVATTAALGYLGSATNTGGATANPGYLVSDASGGQQSPLWTAYGTTAAGGASGNNATYQANSYGAHFYGMNNDPRLTQVYSVSTSAGAEIATSLQNATVDVYNGKAVVASPFGSIVPPNGIIASPPGTGVRANLSPSKYGPGVLKSATMNANVLSSAEALFLQSEAAARGYITGDPAALYAAGISSSFVDDGLTAAQAATYTAQAAVAFPTGAPLETQIQAIITQKWAALNLYGAFEAFNELRRTGYPAVPVSITPGVSTTVNVSRIPYPVIEYNTNADNVAKEGTINIFTSKIFWAK